MELKVGDRIADATGIWEVIERPYPAPNERTVHARVRHMSQPSSTVLWAWGAEERITVTRIGGAP
jgi:hypothetical protein